MEVALPLAPHHLMMNRNATLDVSEALREKAKVRTRLINKNLREFWPCLSFFSILRVDLRLWPRINMHHCVFYSILSDS